MNIFWIDINKTSPHQNSTKISKMDCNINCDLVEVKYENKKFWFTIEEIKSLKIIEKINEDIYRVEIAKLRDSYFIKFVDSVIPLYEIYMRDKYSCIHGSYKCKYSGKYMIITENMPKLSYEVVKEETIVLTNVPEIITIKEGDITKYIGFSVEVDSYKEKNILEKISKLKIQMRGYTHGISKQITLTEDQIDMIYSQRKLSFDEKKIINFYTHTGDQYINQSLRFGLNEERIKQIYLEKIGVEPTPEKTTKLMNKTKKAIVVLDSLFESENIFKSKNHIYLLRGMKLDKLIFDFNKKVLYKNYVSTTSSSRISTGFAGETPMVSEYDFNERCCMMLLDIEPGIPILGTEYSSSFEDEDEYLLPRNLYFQLTGISEFHLYDRKQFYFTLLHLKVTQD